MTRDEIQLKIIELMREITQKRREIWKLTKRRDKIDSSKGDKDD